MRDVHEMHEPQAIKEPAQRCRTDGHGHGPALETIQVLDGMDVDRRIYDDSGYYKYQQDQKQQPPIKFIHAHS